MDVLNFVVREDPDVFTSRTVAAIDGPFCVAAAGDEWLKAEALADDPADLKADLAMAGLAFLSMERSRDMVYGVRDRDRGPAGTDRGRGE